MVRASHTCAHVTGAATGNPSRARGEYAPIAVVPTSVAQIIDIDRLVALCRRGRGRVTSGSCRFQALRQPVAIQARGVVTDVAADRNHEVQALAAGGLRPTVQALGLQQFAQPERNLDDERGLRVALCFFGFLVDRRSPELSVRTAVPEYL